MLNKEFVVCNLCRNNNSELLYTKKYSDILYQIVKCKYCGLVYMNPRFTKGKNRDLYGEKYYYFSEADDRLNVTKAVDHFKTVKSYVSNGRLLEIGCGKGFFLKTAQKDGWEIHGVDISDYACKFAKEQFNLNISLGEFEDIEFLKKYFDVITLWDTLEHLRNPRKTLEKVKGLLKDEGILVIDTPNINSIFYKLYRRYWLGFNPSHLYHFSPRTIKNMLEQLGFRIVDLQTVTVGLFSPEGLWDRGFKTPLAEISDILKLKEKIKRAAVGVNLIPAKRIYPSQENTEDLILYKNKLINLINYPFDYLFNRLRMGDHILVIAKN